MSLLTQYIVNSVPRFENAWMQRSKFPYTARSSAKVIRHAVSIDERRAKFRSDLLSETKMSKHREHHYRGRRRSKAATNGNVPQSNGQALSRNQYPDRFRRPSKSLPRGLFYLKRLYPCRLPKLGATHSQSCQCRRVTFVDN